ncbi:MAG: SsrA-binding protein [Planctomycetota bacterium]|nr:MAG: SsrA-binding protein [Planctomycetota bacterium]
MNRKARFDYEIVDHVEAGIVLLGTEVKALREGKGNLVDAFVDFKAGKPMLLKFEISPYSNDQTGSCEPRRPRPLLLKKVEAARLKARVNEKGLALIPLSVYFKGPWAKVEIGLGRGKAKADKRQTLRKREAQREIDRAERRRR